MNVVIDIGAEHHPPEESTLFLADRYHPRNLYAFDGWPGYEGGIERYNDTIIVRTNRAAWVTNGWMPYRNDGMCSGVIQSGGQRARTFDLAEFILALEERLVLKLDCEGAEYVLLPHIKKLGADELIDLLLIEWHPPHLANGWYVPPSQRPELACEVQDWNDLTGLPTEAERTL